MLLEQAQDAEIANKYKFPSIFHTKADIIKAKPEFRDKFYHFQQAQNWFDVGLQVLEAVQWRPDCARDPEENLQRMLPPKMCPQNPIMVGPPLANKWLTEQEQLELTDKLADATRRVEIQATYGRCKNQFYVVACCVSYLSGVVTHTKFLGFHEAQFAPIFVREQVLAYLLEIAVDFAQDEKLSQMRSQSVSLYIDDSMICNRLRDWYNKGAWRFQSDAGSAIAKLSHLLAAQLRLPLSFYTVDEIFKLEKPVVEDPKDTSTILHFSKIRAERMVQSDALSDWQANWVRVPLSREEIRTLIATRYEEDELKAIKILEQGWSASGNISHAVGLTRHIIKQALNELPHSRKCQTMVCSIICATRFKYVLEGKLTPVACGKCGRRSTFEHLVSCAKLRVPVPTEDPDPTIAFLKELAIRACQFESNTPVPLILPTAEHLELERYESPESETEVLEFD